MLLNVNDWLWYFINYEGIKEILQPSYAQHASSTHKSLLLQYWNNFISKNKKENNYHTLRLDLQKKRLDRHNKSYLKLWLWLFKLW